MSALRERRARVGAVIALALVVVASACGNDSSAPITSNSPDPAPLVEDDGLTAPVARDDAVNEPPVRAAGVPEPLAGGEGLALRVAGRVDGDLICPGDRRPCVPFDGSISLGSGVMVWVAGRLNDGIFEVDDQRALPDWVRRTYVNQCPGQQFDGEPPSDVLQQLYEDESQRPEGFVDLWDSDDGVLHMGIAGDPTSAESILQDLGIADQVCLVTGYAYSDALLEAVQFAATEAAGSYGFDGYSSDRDSWEGTVTLYVPRSDQGLREILDQISAVNDGVPIGVSAAVEVVNGSLRDYEDLLAAIEVTPDASQQLRATCGSVTFSAVPPDLDEFPPLDPDAESALDELINGPTGVEAVGFGGDTQWSIASRTEENLVLFGQQQGADEASWSDVRFERRDGAWTPTGWGGCRIQIEAPGLGPATVATNPDQPLNANDIELSLLIQEQNCASGRAPVDREVVALVTETNESVTIIALVAPVEGGAECPGNPWHPIAVTLDSPLGSRKLFDGHRYPTEAIAPADDFNN